MSKANNHSNINKHLTQNELHDYVSGVLGNEEMYRLELHLNDCALCSEAVDGLMAVQDKQAAFNSLHELKAGQPKPPARFNYGAIAAGLASVAVVGLVLWLFNRQPALPVLVDNQPVSKQQTHPLSQQPPTIVTDTPQDSLPANNQFTEPDRPALASTNEKTTNAKKPVAVLPETAPPAEAPVELTLDAPLEEIIVEADTEKKESEIAEIVTTVEPSPPVARAAKKSSNLESKQNGISTTSEARPNQKQPLPKGGMAALKTYITTHLQYPEQARQANIKGTVLIEVTIGTDGRIKNMQVLKALGYGCDAEAMRVLMDGPPWTPKVVNGVPQEAKAQVKVKFKP